KVTRSSGGATLFEQARTFDGAGSLFSEWAGFGWCRAEVAEHPKLFLDGLGEHVDEVVEQFGRASGGEGVVESPRPWAGQLADDHQAPVAREVSGHYLAVALALDQLEAEASPVGARR